MEKSITIYKLKLPQDVLDHICSFGFYTLEQSIEQNKKIHKKVLLDIKHGVQINNVPLYTSSGTIHYCIYIEFPIREHKVIYGNLCGKCNNFIHLKRKSFGCNCFF